MGYRKPTRPRGGGGRGGIGENASVESTRSLMSESGKQ